MTVAQLIYTAMRLAGILKGPQVQPSLDDLADGLDALNSLIDQAANQRLMIYQVARTPVNVVANQAAYQIGAGAADWNLPWPPRIDRASIILQSATPGPQELPMLVMSTIEEWQAVPLKNTPSTFPLWAYYDRAYPIGVFNVWPVPQENNQIALYLWTLLAPFADTTVTVTLPPGYQRWLEYTLALDLADRYPAEAVITPAVDRKARDATAWLKSMNASPIVAVSDSGARSTRGIFDWRIGQSR